MQDTPRLSCPEFPLRDPSGPGGETLLKAVAWREVKNGEQTALKALSGEAFSENRLLAAINIALAAC